MKSPLMLVWLESAFLAERYDHVQRAAYIPRYLL